MTATILIVDDSATMRALVRGALEADQHAVVEAPNGEAALATLAGMSTGVDLVITDVIMPEMTGPELIRHLKADHDRDFAVLFVTGYVGEGESEELRGYELLRKPFTVGALANAVSAALARTATEPPRTSAGAGRG